MLAELREDNAMLAKRMREAQEARMRLFARRPLDAAWVLFAAALTCAATALASCARRVSFASEHDAAVVKMMAAMNVEHSGDADAEFVKAMIPHHQGAIDMAKAELLHGDAFILRRRSGSGGRGSRPGRHPLRQCL
jgi:uncharacterized protein (DUF305 family)